MCKRLNKSACTNVGIGNDAVGAYANPIAQADNTFKDAIDINLYILATAEPTAHIQAGRVGQAHTLEHQALCLYVLKGSLERGQLHRVVHTFNLPCVTDAVRLHLTTISHGKLHHVRQVILFLGIVVVQACQPSTQQTGGNGHDAAVNFLNKALLGCGVFFFHDGLHLRLSVAHQAAIARGCGGLQSQQGQVLAVAHGQQGA